MKIMAAFFFLSYFCVVMIFRKIAAAILACVYLLSATETGELLKIPFLVAHYHEYKQGGNDNGPVAFLVQHYYIEDGTDKDATEDSQLPFKSAEQFSSTSFVSSSPPASINIKRPESPYQRDFITRNDLFISATSLAAIWQPPRIC